MILWHSGTYKYAILGNKFSTLGLIDVYYNFRTGTYYSRDSIVTDVGGLYVPESVPEYSPTTSKGTFLTSSDPNAYPDRGYKNGVYTIKCEPR